MQIQRTADVYVCVYMIPLKTQGCYVFIHYLSELLPRQSHEGAPDPDPSDFVKNNSQAIYSSAPWHCSTVRTVGESLDTRAARTQTTQGLTCFKHKI